MLLAGFHAHLKSMFWISLVFFACGNMVNAGKMVDMCGPEWDDTICGGFDRLDKDALELLAIYAVLECSPLSPSPKCSAGYFGKTDNKTGEELWYPCCDGYYCPDQIPCRIKCSQGAYCSQFKSVPDPDAPVRCMLYGGIVSSFKNSEGRSSLICGGATRDLACPEGFFCPNSAEMEICPAGHYCRHGEISPQKCPALTICPEGTRAPTLSLAGLSAVFAFFVVLVLYSTSIHRFRAVFSAVRVKMLYLVKGSDKANDRRTLVLRERQSTMDVIRHDIDNFLEELAVEDFRLGALHSAGNSSFGQQAPTEMAGMRTSSVDPMQFSLPQKRSSACSLKTSLFRKKEFTVDIEFRELGLDLKVSRRRILHSVNGVFRAGEVAAIMGPSGAGKTSFLFALSGKAEAYGDIRGEIKINGEERSINEFRDIVGFVPQHDIMHSNLTVREILEFNAKCRLPRETTAAERTSIVSGVIELLGLTHIQDVVVGDEKVRGISGGQKKRVNIGMELVADPAVLFLDEPTSGLDSTTSQDVMKALNEIAALGVNVIVVLHQPRFEIFSKFDKILLLGTGGRTVYMGPRSDIVPYFLELGYELPFGMNPADFIMDCTSGTLKNKTDRSFSPEILVLRWEERENVLGSFALVPVHQVSRNRNYEKRVYPGFWKQLGWCLHRNYVQMKRDKKIQICSWLLFSFAGLAVGVLFANPPLIQIPLGAFMLLIAISIPCTTHSLRLFGTELLELKREAWAGINMNSYFAAKMIISLFDVLFCPLLFLILYYGFAAPRASAAAYYGILLLTFFSCQGIAFIVSLTMQEGRAELFSMILTLVLMMLSGVRPSLAQLREVGAFGKFLYSISFGRFAAEAVMILEFEKLPPVFDTFKMGFAEKQGIEYDNFGYDILCLVVMGICLRIGGYIALRRKSRLL